MQFDCCGRRTDASNRMRAFRHVVCAVLPLELPGAPCQFHGVPYGRKGRSFANSRRRAAYVLRRAHLTSLDL